MQEVYVTGSSGFIGSHLVKRLDTFTPIPHEQIAQFKPKDFSKFYFLSTYGNMAFHNQDEKEVIKANLLDLTHILENTNWNTVQSFVYISSSSVRLRRQTMYSRAKRAAEEILLAYMEKYDAPICIIRPYSVTGVGEQPQHLIPTLIRSCLSGEKMKFVSRPVHDFIDVDDVVEGIVNLSTHKAKGIFELGSGEGVSNATVKNMVEKVAGKKANIEEVESMRDYDNQEWISGNYKARMYGWLPRVSLEASIERMVKAYAK